MITIWLRQHRKFILRIHRIHTPLALDPGQRIQLDGSQAHYLGRVLRVSAGQTVALFNGDGHEYVAEITDVSKRGVSLHIDSRLPGISEPGVKITVVQAISRGERMDHTLQKCTELGACAFQPLFADRVEVRLRGDKAAKRQQHWQGVVISACEQSGRAVVPPVHTPLGLEEWLASPAQGQRLVLAPEAGCRLADTLLESSVELAVGPEGGFSEVEMARMTSNGVQAVSLGPRILRTETAGPAALAIMLALSEAKP